MEESEDQSGDGIRILKKTEQDIQLSEAETKEIANSLLAEAPRNSQPSILSRRHGEKRPSQNTQQPIAHGGTAQTKSRFFVFPPCLRERMVVGNFFLP
jgi:hypothetical protein